ncbi:MAG: ornithine carbamoyltransferase [Euryarchaeota archaeon]|nr:ornithine carbamoyltransferase [Euryarchaeota archaeon]
MHLISILDMEGIIEEVFSLAEELKHRAKRGELEELLRGRTLAMIFEKASTRTRVSFEVAMAQLGGHALYLSPKDMQLGRGETIADTARTLSRYVDAVMIRAYRHGDVVELARHASVPVINGLTDLEHPCQAASDFFTMRELKGRLRGVKLAYVGDGNNVCHSLLLGSAMLGIKFSCATPPGYEPQESIVERARALAEESGAEIEVLHSPREAVAGADFVYTDVWVSMGQESEAERRMRDFRGYQVNSELLRHAPRAKVMHCLPAKRGYEITDEVMDGEASIVWEQAENRLHVQKAILVRLLGGG